MVRKIKNTRKYSVVRKATLYPYSVSIWVVYRKSDRSHAASIARYKPFQEPIVEIYNPEDRIIFEIAIKYTNRASNEFGRSDKLYPSPMP
jgi:hypothetical protein